MAAKNFYFIHVWGKKKNLKIILDLFFFFLFFFLWLYGLCTELTQF